MVRENILKTEPCEDFSGLCRPDLEKLVVSNADQNQVEEIISEAKDTVRLRCYFNEKKMLFKALSHLEKDHIDREPPPDELQGHINQSVTEADARRYISELTKRFFALENHVLSSVDLQNTWQIVSIHLHVRNQSIELLEEVINTIPITTKAFPPSDKTPIEFI